jgi:hypothetical protein
MIYPPTINAARLLAHLGAQVLCIGGVDIAAPPLAMVPGARIEYASYGTQQGRLARLGWAVGRHAFRHAVMAACRGFGPDLVVAYDVGAGWAVLPLLGSTTTTVMHVHDNPSPEQFSWHSVRGWQWRAVMSHAHRFAAWVVPDAQRAQHLNQAWGIPVQAKVVANVPPLTKPQRNRLLRDRLGLGSSTAPLAVVVGNIGLLPELVAAMAGARAPWQLAVIGAGDAALVDRALRVAEQLGIRPRIHVIGYTSYDVMRSWLPGCDVGLALYPSDANSVNWRLMGSGSVKVMEYVAAQVPAIVCSKRAFATLAAETGALHVLEAETVDAIRSALDRLEPHTEYWQRLADAARAAHVSRFNLEGELGAFLRDLGLAI